MSWKRVKSRSKGQPDYLRPERRETTHRGAVPTLGDINGAAVVLDVLMRAGVYVAIHRGGSGAVLFVDVFDNYDRRRYECTSQDELEDALTALSVEFER